MAARTSRVPVHLVMCGSGDVEEFFVKMSISGAVPRQRCEEDRFELRYPFLVQSCEFDVEEAELSYLEPIAKAQAELALLESGVDPLTRDPEGFLKRVARRIEQGRVFSVVENGRLIFKADIIAETSDTIYLEGIYVDPEFRGNGIGSRCLSALCQQLLSRVSHICLLSNSEFTEAHRSFEKAGFIRTAKCVTLFA